MGRLNLRKNFFAFTLIVAFIILYLSLFIFIYIIPNGLSISIFILIGIIIIVVSIFLFINLNHDETDSTGFKIKFFSENFTKTILVVLMCFAMVIKPITNKISIILWDKISVWNYVRAFIFIIGIAFLPGSCLFKIFFHDNQLHEKFKVEPFIIKITFYPLLSFAFIGISVLILDQIGLTNIANFSLILFILNIEFYILDFIIQKVRFKSLNIKTVEISFSKNVLIILLIAVGFILISLGTHFGTWYLVPGDSWAGLSPSHHIGVKNTSSVEWGSENINAPIFWACVVYGLSSLVGLPLINTNALLGPFSYLYITSIYLLMKAILYGFKEKYAVLSTILTSLTSGLFYISSDLTHGKVNGIIIVENFIYKSYAYILFFAGLAIFILILKTSDIFKDNEVKFLKKKELKLLVLSSFFLLLCFMTYPMPLLLGLIFIFLYCLISSHRKKDFRLYSYLILIIIILFICFDIVMAFYLSSAGFIAVQWFFNIPLLSMIFRVIPTNLFIYLILGGFFVLCINFEKIYNKCLKELIKIFNKYTCNHKLLKVILIAFTIILFVEIIVIIFEEASLIFFTRIIFFYYFDQVLLNIGFIGILAVYFSYLTYRRDKNLFFTLFIWTIISFFLASLLIFLNVFTNFTIFMKEIDNSDIFLMEFWFNRICFYSIIPLSILSSIGMFKFGKKLKLHSKFKNILANEKNFRFFKVLAMSLIILLSFTNFFLFTIFRGDANRPNEDQIEVIEWMSDNIPQDSGILMKYEYIIRLGTYSMSYGSPHYINDIFKKDYTQDEFISEIGYLRDEEVQYMILNKDFLDENTNQSEFIKNYLIPNFYNETEYENDEYLLYYAPFFD